MDTKKSIRADLESRRVIFLEIGLSAALTGLLVAFNVRSYDSRDVIIGDRDPMDIIEVDVPITAEKIELPPPPEKLDMPTELDVVSNDTEPINEVIGFDSGDDIHRAQIAIDNIVVPEEVVVEEDPIILAPEEDAEFPGGLEALAHFLANNIKYPTVAKENGITGRVYVSFVIEKDGSIANVTIRRDIGGGCGTEAVRVIKSMPRWKPGKQHGAPVRSSFTLPVNFDLK